jgi:SNF2 family DNA or RNA helicase
MITSYEIAMNDISFLKKINWKAMVVDEAHRLKNNESKFFKLSYTIKSGFKMLLTGTPLQNNIGELFNLIEFICP